MSAAPAAPSSIYDIEVKDAMGKVQPLGDLVRGKAFLVVNTASGCGYTPQFKGLQELYETYKDRGFTVLAFPSNDFNQELPTDAEAHDFACSRFKTTFPMFSRTKVTGSEAHPLFKALGKAKPGLMGREAPFWNFSKFAVDSKGEVIERYGPPTEPSAIAKDIEKILPAAAPTTASTA